ncbi:MAG: winged helix-turn-helix transcriptional regulator, partial [Candidatus Heimdallarchaeaceae archaeon]
MLEVDEYLILQEIFRNPILPYSHLAERVGLSPPTAKKRVQQLFKKGILYDIKAEYSPESLGLESHIFLLRVESIDKLRIVERFLDFHPYLVIRSRCFGTITGTLFKVHVPVGSIDYVKEFLKHLKEVDLIEDIVHSTAIGRGIKTHIDLSYWDQKNSSWNFKWTLWERNTDSVDYVPHFDYFRRLSQEKPKNVLKHMKYEDFQILAQLLVKPLQKQATLAEKLNIPQYTFSRRVKFLEKHVIRNYVVEFNREYFGLTDEMIFKAVCNQRAMSKLIYLLQNLDLPFESDFRNTENGFLWKILLPAKDKLKLIDILW